MNILFTRNKELLEPLNVIKLIFEDIKVVPSRPSDAIVCLPKFAGSFWLSTILGLINMKCWKFMVDQWALGVVQTVVSPGNTTITEDMGLNHWCGF